jgi:hypothetical protein
MDPRHLFGFVIIVVLVAIFVISRSAKCDKPATSWRSKISEVTGIGKDPPEEAEIHKLVKEINAGL